MPDINVVQDDLETLFVQVQLSDLGPTTPYDVYRMQWRYVGKDAAGNRQYERELPDRRGLYTAVGHRISWVAGSSSAVFRDYECPRRPTRYFLVETGAQGPHEYDNWSWAEPYPLWRGALSPQVVHFNQDLVDANLGLEPTDGHLLIRSTDELAQYVNVCLVDLQGPTYSARGTEHAVLGSQYPVYISDSREARRGTFTVLVKTLGAYLDLKRIVFPSSGLIKPVMVQSGLELLDDMKILPLNVEVEQVTQRDVNRRYVHVDFVEIDPSGPLVARSGDNDDLAGAPTARFTVSKTNPKVNEWITLDGSASSGVFDSWEWTIEGHDTDNRMGKWFTAGPHQVRWHTRGKKTVKLRVYGAGAGAHTRSKVITVGP